MRGGRRGAKSSDPMTRSSFAVEFIQNQSDITHIKAPIDDVVM